MKRRKIIGGGGTQGVSRETIIFGFWILLRIASFSVALRMRGDVISVYFPILGETTFGWILLRIIRFFSLFRSRLLERVSYF